MTRTYRETHAQSEMSGLLSYSFLINLHRSIEFIFIQNQSRMLINMMRNLVKIDYRNKSSILIATLIALGHP